MFLIPIDANGTYKVFGQTSNVNPFMRKHIQLVLDLQGGETIVESLRRQKDLHCVCMSTQNNPCLHILLVIERHRFLG